MSETVDKAVAVPTIDNGGLLSGTEELRKAISMGLLDTALFLGWEPEETFEDDDEVLFSQRCQFPCVRDSKWRMVAQDCGELRLNKFTRTSFSFQMRHEDGSSFVASFFAGCAPPFGVLVPLRSAGWKFFVIDCSRDDPKIQHVALVFASTQLAGEFKVAFEEADRVNKVILEAG